jgi:hypothetical protein
MLTIIHTETTENVAGIFRDARMKRSSKTGTTLTTQQTPQPVNYNLLSLHEVLQVGVLLPDSESAWRSFCTEMYLIVHFGVGHTCQNARDFFG